MRAGYFFFFAFFLSRFMPELEQHFYHSNDGLVISIHSSNELVEIPLLWYFLSFIYSTSVIEKFIANILN